MDFKSLKKAICKWSYAWAQKLFSSVAEDITLWDVLIKESNQLIDEKPEELRKLYSIAYMQSLGAYYSFFLNENQENDYQIHAMSITEWCVEKIIEAEANAFENAA